jgi:hypothetical protein
MDNLKQNNRRRDIVAQCYCMVKIPGAELRYTGTQKRSNGQGQSDRGTRLKD